VESSFAGYGVLWMESNFAGGPTKAIWGDIFGLLRYEVGGGYAFGSFCAFVFVVCQGALLQNKLADVVEICCYD